MASNLECVGLGVRDKDEFMRLAQEAFTSASRLGSRGGVDVIRWQDPGGARLIFGVQDGKVLELLPSFSSSPGARLSSLHMVNDQVASAEVVDECGEPATMLVFEPEQRRLLTVSDGIPSVAAMVALGVEVEVFADAKTFAAKSDMNMSAESFIPYGTFHSPQEATAHAWVAGTVLAASRRETRLTGQEFLVARVRTYGFETDVCLAAREHLRTPRPGQVIAGTVFLVGDLFLEPTR